jgi:membrane protease YdiL (CAAX protease family)
MNSRTDPRPNPALIPRRTAFVIGIAIFLIVEFIARFILLPQYPTSQDVWRSMLLEWTMFVGLLFIWIPRFEREDLRSIGVTRFQTRHLTIGIAAYILSFIPIAILGYVLAAQGLPTLQSLQPLLASYSLPTMIGLVLTGVILEEFLFRGYLIERVDALSARKWPALIISWLTFTLVHWKFVGFYPMLQIGIMSAFLVLVFARERSVWPCSVFHGINSLLVYLLFPLALS